MNLERKKELLMLVDSMAKDINRSACGNFMPRVINAVEIGKRYDDKDKFKKALESMKRLPSGGNTEEQGYINVVDNIINKSEYKIDSLDFEELMFVCSWLRRVIKTKSNSNSNSKNNRNANNNNYKNNTNKKSIKNTSSINYNKNNKKVNNNLKNEIDEDNLFAQSLKNYFK